MPSVTKLVHVRFIRSDEDDVYKYYDVEDVEPAQFDQCRKKHGAKSAAKSFPYGHVKTKALPTKSKGFSKIMSLLEMLKMGKGFHKNSTVITLHSKH